ncbi:uncharacterized protein [Macrobrachium rosenbergii]|uniref:uncharacterized protein n=1 Tax=Macrobrachium rosenbergii TaxID=79674 RepID=UPI0034D5E10E
MIVSVFTVVAALAAQASAHMSLEEPPARNVMWRMGFNQLPAHRDDDYLICNESGGKKCPPCGDSADSPPPYPHQAGGIWATGIITRTYTIGQTVEIHVNVTRSHGGHLEFKLCPNDDTSVPVDQRCLDQYPLEIVDRRSKKAKISAPYDEPELISLKVKLPNGLTCDQCILQMTNFAEQFKPQNIMFRNCADIAIVADAKTSGAAGKPVAFNARPTGNQEPFPVQRQHTLFNGKSSHFG